MVVWPHGHEALGQYAESIGFEAHEVGASSGSFSGDFESQARAPKGQQHVCSLPNWRVGWLSFPCLGSYFPLLQNWHYGSHKVWLCSTIHMFGVEVWTGHAYCVPPSSCLGLSVNSTWVMWNIAFAEFWVPEGKQIRDSYCTCGPIHAYIEHKEDDFNCRSWQLWLF